MQRKSWHAEIGRVGEQQETGKGQMQMQMRDVNLQDIDHQELWNA